jgi:hypothetical protein
VRVAVRLTLLAEAGSGENGLAPETDPEHGSRISKFNVQIFYVSVAALPLSKIDFSRNCEFG